jgi:hypothetical protein
VLELEAGGRFAYFHYIGKHPDYGDTVLVNPRLQERQASVTADIFSGAYVAFYPVTAAVSQGLVDVVAHLLPPNLPNRLRRAGARSGRRIDTWIIEDGSREVVKANLSDEERRLPIAAIWNHELLVQRIVEGWTPMQEGRGVMNYDAQVIREIAAVSGGDRPHTILHYLYVPSSEAASKVAEELKQRGFRTEERLGADGVNWLVLARHEVVPTEELVASMRRSMETLIAKFGGEYDGWEADI